MNIETSSFEQFKKDFEEYPFNDSDDITWQKSMNYKIVNISKFKNLISKFQQLVIMTPKIYSIILNNFFDKQSKLSRSIFLSETKIYMKIFNDFSAKGIWKKYYLDKSSNLDNEIIALHKQVKNALYKSYLLTQTSMIYLFAVILLSVSPLILLAAFANYLFSFQKNAMGFYSSFLSNKTLYVVNYRNNFDYLTPLISHEHIHMIQDEMYKSGLIDSLVFDKAAISEDIFHTEKLNRVGKKCPVDYLFSPLEIEARLHEVVLTYYRAKKIMPKNADEFIDLVLDFRFFAHSTDSDYEDLLETRFPSGVDNFFFIQFKVLNRESACIFINHVLPIFYRRLLTYYGAATLIKEFDQSPPDRTLFDKLFISI